MEAELAGHHGAGGELQGEEVALGRDDEVAHVAGLDACVVERSDSRLAHPVAPCAAVPAAGERHRRAVKDVDVTRHRTFPGAVPGARGAGPGTAAGA